MTVRWRNIFYWLLASGIWFLAGRCAQIVNPTGGPKDASPPRAVKYIPDSAKTNFASKNIVIAFDEFIQLNDLQKQLVISPPMTVLPEIKVKGKMLLMELRDSLKKNTTYTFNFGNSIRDITENNAAENFQYVFSTGSYLDSLSISGTVKNAFDQKTDKGIAVMLYAGHSDSVPYKMLPSYFTRTKEDGTYRINNIRQGTYKAFALKETNGNYLYDSPDESIAFCDTLVSITKNTSLDLSLFKEEPKKQKLKKAYFSEHGHLVLALAKPAMDTVTVQFLSTEPKEYVTREYSKNKDTLHYWFADDVKDTLKIRVLEGETVLDTLRMKQVTMEQMKKSTRGEKWGLKLSVNAGKGKMLDRGKPLRISFNHPVPVKGIKSPGIMLRSASGRETGCTDKAVHSLYARAWERSCTLSSDSTYHLFIPPGTFTDIFGLTNDTLKAEIKVQEEKYYGTLKLNLNMKYDKAFLLQLINEKGEIFNYESSDKSIFSYSLLPPGSYKLRIIYDENGDNKWTTGNYLKKKKPETVIYYPGAITIRSNWDLELEWKAE